MDNFSNDYVFCPGCGQQVPGGYQSCQNCGAVLNQGGFGFDSGYSDPFNQGGNSFGGFSGGNGGFTGTATQTKKPKKKKLLPILAAILALCLVCAAVFVIYYNRTPDIETVKDSVVKFEIYDADEQLFATGSGFCAFKSNWIVTNFHVIEGARYIKVITDDHQSINVSRIIVYNKAMDLAIVEIEGELNPLRLGDGDIRVKDNVVAIGSPKGQLNTVSEGIISNDDDKSMIRITAPISHGSSGGVLLNEKYRVIGITSAGYDDAQNLNFAISVNILKGMYDAYKDGKFDWYSASDYDAFLPDITQFNTDNTLEILSKAEGGSYYHCSPSNLEAFYLATNPSEIFAANIAKASAAGKNSFCDSYNAYNADGKWLISELYTLLLQYESRTEDDPAYSPPLGTIAYWDPEQFIMELDLMKTFELAVFLVDLESLSTPMELAEYLDASTLSYESCILIYRLYFPNDDTFNGEIKQFINRDSRFTNQQREQVLDYLGVY